MDFVAAREQLCLASLIWFVLAVEKHIRFQKKAGCCSKRTSIFGTKFENLFHRGVSVFSGISGKGSKSGTKELLKQIDAIHPDILHLHNLHGWYINLPMLFDYIKKNNIRTVWTLHDCWGFTAQCSHFTMENVKSGNGVL